MINERLSATLSEVSFLKLSSFCLKLFILVLPFQIRTLIFNCTVLITGNFNEYASFFIYAGDIFILTAAVFFGFAIYKKEVKKVFMGDPIITLLILLYVLSLMFSIFIADQNVLVLLLIFRYLEFLILYFLLVNGVLARSDVLNYFIYSLFVQSFIAIEQYLFQSSVGLGFLGESNISAVVPGVAKMDIGGDKVIRAYGTFLHPNLLAGFLIIALFWIYHSYKKKMWLYLTATSFLLIALVFTFSRSAFIAFGGAFLIYFSISNKKFPIQQILLWISVFLLIVVAFNLEEPVLSRLLAGSEDTASVERMQYLQISKNMLSDNPLGVGLGHFTLVMQDYVATKLSPWSMQPVHNVYLLIASEAGLISAAIFLILLGYLFYFLLVSFMRGSGDDKNFALIQLSILTIFLIIFLFDHYFYSFYQGQALFFIYLALSSSLTNRFLLPNRKS